MHRCELPETVTRLMSNTLGSEWKWYKGYEEVVSHYPCYPSNCVYSRKKTQTDKKQKKRQKKANSGLQHLRTNFQSMISEECFDSFMTEVPIICFYRCNL